MDQLESSELGKNYGMSHRKKYGRYSRGGSIVSWTMHLVKTFFFMGIAAQVLYVQHRGESEGRWGRAKERVRDEERQIYREREIRTDIDRW